MGDDTKDLIFRLARELAALMEIHYVLEDVPQVLPEALQAIRDAHNLLPNSPDSVEIVVSRCQLH